MFVTAMMLPAAFLAFTVDAHADNIVANPSFETGDFTDWVRPEGLNEVTSSWFVFQSAYAINGPEDGEWFAETDCVGSICISTPTSFFYQDLPTVAGQTYTLSFRYDLGACQDGCGAEELKVLWAGNAAFDLATTTSGTTDPGWVEATVNGLQASSTVTRLEFIGRQDPGALGLDNIDVSALTQTVPEPSSLVVLASALAAVAVIKFRRKERGVPQSGGQ
jgi:hypothetical protein